MIGPSSLNTHSRLGVSKPPSDAQTKRRNQPSSKARVTSDDEDDENEEWSQLRCPPPPTRKPSSRKAKRQPAGDEPDVAEEKKAPGSGSRRKTKSSDDCEGPQKKKKPGRPSRSHSDSNSDNEQPHVQPVRALHAPRSKSRFQTGCTLPSIEEESEEEEAPAKSKPAFVGLTATTKKRMDPPSVLTQESLLPLPIPSTHHSTTVKSRAQAPPASVDSRKRQREVDPVLEELDEDGNEPPPAKPARKRAKTTSAKDSTKRAVADAAATSKPSSKKNSSRKGAGSSKQAVKPVEVTPAAKNPPRL